MSTFNAPDQAMKDFLGYFSNSFPVGSELPGEQVVIQRSGYGAAKTREILSILTHLGFLKTSHGKSRVVLKDCIELVNFDREQTLLEALMNNEKLRFLVKYIKGNFKSGDTLPGERDFSRELHWGRQKFREQIKTLDYLGYCKSQHGNPRKLIIDLPLSA